MSSFSSLLLQIAVIRRRLQKWVIKSVRLARKVRRFSVWRFICSTKLSIFISKARSFLNRTCKNFFPDEKIYWLSIATVLVHKSLFKTLYAEKKSFVCINKISLKYAQLLCSIARIEKSGSFYLILWNSLGHNQHFFFMSIKFLRN